MAGWAAADCCVLWPGKAELGGTENLGFQCDTGLVGMWIILPWCTTQQKYFQE